jgi:2-methylcitrate dehydratase
LHAPRRHIEAGLVSAATEKDFVLMDATTSRLVDFALESDYARLSAHEVHECKRRLIDTIGCALGACEDPLSGMARAVAARAQGDPPARIWGSHATSTPELAAFANGVMLRLRDISDTYLGRARGHPSDVTAAVLAAADIAHSDGRSVIAATALAYDVYCSLCDALDWNAKGWDQPVYAVLGAVVGVGRLLGLTRTQLGHAVALALVPNMALAQARRGALSSWKGCAGANAARNAVFAALLARDGFTGPTAVFEGEGGLFDVVGRFHWKLPEERLIVHTHIKTLPVCYHGQSAVLLALEMRSRLALERIEAIRVDAYRTAVDMMGRDPSRWAPTTHETADHSLPYTVAIALLDGEVTEASYDPERFSDPAVVALMQKVTVHEDPELDAQYPEGAPSRLTVQLAQGGTQSAHMRYPTGHAKSAIGDADLERKFRGMIKGPQDSQRSAALLQRLWQLEQVRYVGADVLELTAA